MWSFGKNKQNENSTIVETESHMTIEHLTDVDQLVLDYIKSPNTDYAIMLKGAWGVGKTYYWNNSLSRDIEQIDSPFKVKDKIVKYKAIRVSLFGIENLNSLIMRITRAKYLGENKWINVLASVVSTGVKRAANKYEVDSEQLELLVNTLNDVDQKRFIYCFDDLERLDEGLLLDVLGYINSLVENDGIKVIILCNEDELINSLSENSNYPVYKEKLIRFSFQMSADIEKVLDSLLDNKEDDFKQFILNKKNYIVDFYKKGNCDNIRTLKFNIEVFQQLYSIISGIDLQNHRDQILDHYLMLSMLYAIEYKNGASNEQLQDLLSLTSETSYAFDFDISYFNKLAGVDSQIKEESEPTYIEKVIDKYFSKSPAKIGSSASFLDYMKTGRLDKTQISDDISHTMTLLQDKEMSEEQQLLTKLDNVWILDDQILSDTINALMEKASNGELSLDLYTTTFSRINLLISNEYLKGPDTNELTEIFLSGIQKARPRTTYSEKFESEYQTMSYDLDKDSKVIADAVLKIFKELGKDEEIKKFQEYLHRLWLESVDMKDFKTSPYPLLVSLNPEMVIKSFLNTDNVGKSRFVTFIQGRVEYAVTAVQEESAFFTPFKGLCVNYLRDNTEPSIIRKYMVYLVDLLSKYGY